MHFKFVMSCHNHIGYFAAVPTSFYVLSNILLRISITHRHGAPSALAYTDTHPMLPAQYAAVSRRGRLTRCPAAERIGNDDRGGAGQCGRRQKPSGDPPASSGLGVIDTDPLHSPYTEQSRNAELLNGRGRLVNTDALFVCVGLLRSKTSDKCLQIIEQTES